MAGRGRLGRAPETAPRDAERFAAPSAAAATELNQAVIWRPSATSHRSMLGPRRRAAGLLGAAPPPPIHHDATAAPGRPPTAHWLPNRGRRSPSVAALVRQATSKAPSDAAPMIIEGPRGTRSEPWAALRTTPSPATRSASQCIAERKKRAVDGVEMLLPPPLTDHEDARRLKPVAEYEDLADALERHATRAARGE